MIGPSTAVDLRNFIKFLGDDPDREGLKETPERVMKAWYTELCSGYRVNIKDIFTTFDNEERYNEIILLKNIQFSSVCEHHMLPFMGMGHVAYIPNANIDGSSKIAGISKLARLLDAIARRLQTQERICVQVVKHLNANLHCAAAACILEAKHCCISCRGVSKQSAVMVTSHMTGAFYDKPQTRQELLALIKG